MSLGTNELQFVKSCTYLEVTNYYKLNFEAYYALECLKIVSHNYIMPFLNCSEVRILSERLSKFKVLRSQLRAVTFSMHQM